MYFPTSDYQEVSPYYRDDFPHKASFYNVPGAYHTAIRDRVIADAVEKLSGKIKENAVINYHDNKYTYYDYDSVKMMLQIFSASSMDRAVEDVLGGNSNRFIGNPEAFDVTLEDRLMAGDIAGAKETCRGFISAIPLNWRGYEVLGWLQSMEGNHDDALRSYLSCPLFNLEEGANQVHLSTMAYSAGETLASQGGLKEATRMLKLSESYGTGSASELLSSAELALIDGDYSRAIFHYSQMVDRYQSVDALGSVMSLMYMTGKDRDVREVFDASTSAGQPQILSAIMVGRRIQQKTLSDTFQVLLGRNDFNSWVSPRY